MQESKNKPAGAPGIKRIIGIMSGKGGTGKTFAATSLALTLAKLGQKTALLDADIYCPNVFKMLGIQSKITSNAEHKLIPIEKWGVKMISMAGLCATNEEPVIWRGPIISKIIQQMILQTVWGEIDTLVIDFPTGSGDSVVTILQNFPLDGVIIVTTPQEIAAMDARRTINMAYSLKVPVLGVLENMRGEIFGEGGGSKVAEGYRLPLLGSIPMRKQIVGMCDQGIPPIFHIEELEMIFTRAARHILEKIAVE